MPRVERSALVPYPAERMFELVDDVESYPEFLPWCADARVLERREERMRAELVVARAGIRHAVRTENARRRPEHIELHLLDGPFSHFEGRWRFTRLAADASKVALHLEFEYSGRMVRFALGPFFNRAADTLVDAFCERAHALHREGRWTTTT